MTHATVRTSQEVPVPVGSTGEDVLVLADGRRRGDDFLALPFQEVTVVTPPDQAAVGGGEGYSAIIIDRSPFDLQWLAETTRKVVPALREGGRVVVALDPADQSPPSPDPSGAPIFDGLTWGGLETLNGRVCAVLPVAEPDGGGAEAIAVPLAAAQAAVRLATSTAVAAGTGAAFDEARHVLGRELERRYRSERALLARLERLTAHRQVPATPTSLTVREVIGRSRLGPFARGLLRQLRRIRRALQPGVTVR